jgi:isoleucyl-tRNA synthetase
MFPYPSGSGLHIGHFYNYCHNRTLIVDIIDIEVNKYFNHSGFDSFGLPLRTMLKKLVGIQKMLPMKILITLENKCLKWILVIKKC